MRVSDDRPPEERFREARNAFEYNDHERAVAELEALLADGRIADVPRQVEAYRMLGIAYHSLGRRDASAAAFLTLLRRDPEHRLDPFLVPPSIVNTFDAIKDQHRVELDAIRERLRREREELERDRQEMIRRERERQATAAAAAVARIVERDVARGVYLLNWLPLGAGQFQNGNARLGWALAGGQVAAAMTSLGAFFAVEGLRDERGFVAADAQSRADTLSAVRLGSGLLFYALWAGGVVESHVAYERQRVLAERVRVHEGKPEAVEAVHRSAESGVPMAVP